VAGAALVGHGGYTAVIGAQGAQDNGKALIDKVAGAGDSGNGGRPPNLSPEGAGRSGAFNEAKRRSGVPTSQQPTRVGPNLDRRGNVQPGRAYEFEVPAEGGGAKTITIRDDSKGHYFGPNDTQNRGPHFNDAEGNHYDY
jgi:filamentous hemagglutinin